MEAKVTLGAQQRAFTLAAGRLIVFAYENGYELTFGDAYRTLEQAELNAMGPVHRARCADLIATQYPMLATKIRQNGVHGAVRASLHTKRLAIDFNLFRNGYYLTDTDSYKPLGDFWKPLHPDARWGGDFMAPDGNHFSFEWEGVR
jgi:hypothetical protein